MGALVWAGRGFRIAVFCLPGEAEIYLKLGAIKGGVTETGYEDWIELSSEQDGVGRSISLVAGKQDVGKAMFTDFQMTKVMGPSSAELFFQSVSGGTVPMAELAFISPGPSEPVEYLRITLKDVLVSEYNFSGDSSGVPEESVSLNFNHVERAYTHFFAGKIAGTQNGILGLAL